MAKILTSAQMRSIEAEAIASGAVTGLELMERAGRGVVEAIFEERPELETGLRKAIVLCGPGNNGGDGFVVARLLKARGWEVLTCLYGEAERLPADAQVMHAKWCEVGDVMRLDVPFEERLHGLMEDFAGPRIEGQALVVVDALFGIGLRRPLVRHTGQEEVDGKLYECFDNDPAMIGVNLDDLWMDGRADTFFVAVDVPSGLCADSGRVLMEENWDFPDDELEKDPRFAAFMAQLTVTFHAPKPGHFLGWGPRMCGKLRVVDIGLDRLVWNGGGGLVGEPYAYWLGKHGGHKFDHGHAVVLSGGHGRAGAARLSARAALRVGAGLVTVGSPPEAMAETAARLDAVMLREVADAAGLEALLADKRVSAVCLGPAFGTGAREAALLEAALRSGRKLVLDADALTLLAGDAGLFGLLHEGCILTPHGGEFARLFPDLAAKLEGRASVGPAYSKLDATREAAVRAGCLVLFKGADTVIADQNGGWTIHAAAYERAAPWLATAGSGDVLAGIITGLMARGFAPWNAACAGAWLHVEAAREFGAGLIAEDLPEMLPAVFRGLGV